MPNENMDMMGPSAAGMVTKVPEPMPYEIGRDHTKTPFQDTPGSNRKTSGDALLEMFSRPDRSSIDGMPLGGRSNPIPIPVGKSNPIPMPFYDGKQEFDLDPLRKRSPRMIGDGWAGGQLKVGGALRQQLAESLKTAKVAALGRMRGLTGDRDAQTTEQQPFNMAELSKVGGGHTNGASDQLMGRIATDAGVKFDTESGDGVPSYEYGGTKIDIPKDVNLMDDNAVGSFISENNMVIDWMNGSNNEEEDF